MLYGLKVLRFWITALRGQKITILYLVFNLLCAVVLFSIVTRSIDNNIFTNPKNILLPCPYFIVLLFGLWWICGLVFFNILFVLIFLSIFFSTKNLTCVAICWWNTISNLYFLVVSCQYNTFLPLVSQFFSLVLYFYASKYFFILCIRKTTIPGTTQELRN